MRLLVRSSCARKASYPPPPRQWCDRSARSCDWILEWGNLPVRPSDVHWSSLRCFREGRCSLRVILAARSSSPPPSRLSTLRYFAESSRACFCGSRTDDGRPDSSRTRVPPSRSPYSILSDDLVFPFPPLSLSVRVARDFKATKIVSYTGTRTDDGIEMASLF